MSHSQHFLLGCTDASLIPETIWRPINLLVQQLARRHWHWNSGYNGHRGKHRETQTAHGEFSSSFWRTEILRSCFQEVAADQEVAQILSEVKGFKCIPFKTISSISPVTYPVSNFVDGDLVNVTTKKYIYILPLIPSRKTEGKSLTFAPTLAVGHSNHLKVQMFLLL